MTMAGKTVLVTGANRGIGQALVSEALSRGAARVYAGTRQPMPHPDGRVTPLTLDVTSTAQIQAAADQIESLDILINNAGVFVFDDLSDRVALERHLAWLTAGARVPPRCSNARMPRSRNHSPSTPNAKLTPRRRRDAMTDHKVVSRAEWQAAVDELLQREKEHTRKGDELARQRQELPWVAIEKQYRFDADDGTRTLAQLFDGRAQLLIYHFMFGPSYQAGCPVNSSIADGLDGLLPHLHARDVTLLLVSQAPLEKLQAYKHRMGWSIPWVSSANTDFNFDFGASFTPEQVRGFLPASLDSLPPIVALNAAATGTDVAGYLSESPTASVFTLRDGAVYLTYATKARGVEFLMGYYPVLDRAPKGRDEGDGFQTWIRRHDEYA